MKAVVQRVKHASVTVDGQLESEIGQGLLILLGIGTEDNTADIEWLAGKIANLRIFNDENQVMNRSLLDKGGDALIVSQFTLMASTKKGNRPSYIHAAKPDAAIPLYNEFIREFEGLTGKKVQTGLFGADMKIDLCNDGPVTIVIDTKHRS
jgi:D-tyrosyl-tRNA(Tyr) deacylase